MRLIGISMGLLLLAGCQSAHDLSPLPTYPAGDVNAAREVLIRRADSVHSFSAQCDVTLSRDDRQTIELNGLLVMSPPDRLRLRTWKLDQIVFDLTLRPDGLWIETPPEARHGGQILPAAVNAAQLARELSWFTGGFFAGGDVRGQVSGGQIVFRRPAEDGGTIECRVDRATLTPREFELIDAAGSVRFTLEMSRYGQFNGIPWPTHLLAIARGRDAGKIELDLSDIRINGELAAGAFVPPRNAEKRQ
jgi:outer membrane lipoprotein-sorting protein